MNSIFSESVSLLFLRLYLSFSTCFHFSLHVPGALTEVQSHLWPVPVRAIQGAPSGHHNGHGWTASRTNRAAACGRRGNEQPVTEECRAGRSGANHNCSQVRLSCGPASFTFPMSFLNVTLILPQSVLSPSSFALMHSSYPLSLSSALSLWPIPLLTSVRLDLFLLDWVKHSVACTLTSGLSPSHPTFSLFLPIISCF